MSLMSVVREYFVSVGSVKRFEYESLVSRIKALESNVRALEQAFGNSDTAKLNQDVNAMRAQMDKLSSRLIGFSKSGIS